MTTTPRDQLYRYHVKVNRIEAHCRLRCFTAPTGDPQWRAMKPAEVALLTEGGIVPEAAS